ncbi:MAG: hypothetical protein M1818_001558 [Claussenomyces sp. TS43310]|nr:MAG: hypothetical protein M1818_001558 [Claussenomyces sp. TS43310]
MRSLLVRSLVAAAAVGAPILAAAYPREPPHATSLNVSVIHEFPKGTWLQDLAIRPSGSILTTTLTAPTIYELGSVAPTTATLLYTFPGVECALGIAPFDDDTYYVTVGNFSFSTFSTVPSSYALYTLTFAANNASAPPTVALAATLPGLDLVNGVVHVPLSPYLLLGDAGAGIIYRFDTRSGGLSVLLNDTLLQHSAIGIEIGVNGLHFAGPHLYFTNTNKALVLRVPFNYLTSAVAGPIEILATGTPMENFALGPGPDGLGSVDVFGAEGNNNDVARVRVAANGTGVLDVIVGSPNSTVVAGPTALVWGVGRDRESLYVSSTGGIVGYMTGHFEVGGRISRIDGVPR